MKRATNSALMRVKNEKIILSLINKGLVSRVDISQKTVRQMHFLWSTPKTIL